jgi:GR25 family glycosyltransferase involved in LPS biosynthesis
MLPIYCISLERERKKRYQKVQNKYFKPLNLDVIEWKATDGNNYKNSKMLASNNNLNLTNLGYELNKSVLATAVSHRSVWQEILDKNLDAAIIMEDDVTIKNDFKDRILEIWDLIKNDDNIKYLLLSYSDNIIIDHQKSTYNNKINKLKNFNGLFCYLVKKEGAKELLEKSDPLSYQIDIHISKNIDTHYCCKKRIGYYNEDIITTIHLHRFKLLEIYFGLRFLNKKILVPIDFYTSTIFSLFTISIGFLLSLFNFYWVYVHLLNFLVFIIELHLVGGRFDEFNIRIPGKIQDIGSYDSDEIANKLVDHLLLSIVFTVFNFIL